MTHDAVNWGWPTLSMPFLHCAGSGWLAIFITIFRVLIWYRYESICRKFLDAAEASGDSTSSEILATKAKVFRFCARAGYGLLALTLWMPWVATIAYYLEAVFFPILLHKSAQLDRQLSGDSPLRVMRELSIGERVVVAAQQDAEKNKSLTLREAIENRLLAMESRGG